jgi:acyl CoA:acetate/3-ketoacid CoA transferase beta subunit
MSGATRAEIAITACSDLFRGAGEILASPTGIIPGVGARLAALTHAPGLMLTDGEATIFADVPAIGAEGAISAGALTYRQLFELIARGRRHVIMGAAQLDRFGNQNLSAIGDHERPTRQLVGTRAAATNTINHAVSYWVARHSQRVFVERVDFVTGIGTDRARAAGASTARFHDLRSVVTNLGVFGFGGPDGSMAITSVHPGVSVAEVRAATGFELPVTRGTLAVTRTPDDNELRLIREVIDPRRRREEEVPTP